MKINNDAVWKHIITILETHNETFETNNHTLVTPFKPTLSLAMLSLIKARLLMKTRLLVDMVVHMGRMEQY